MNELQAYWFAIKMIWGSTPLPGKIITVFIGMAALAIVRRHSSKLTNCAKFLCSGLMWPIEATLRGLKQLTLNTKSPLHGGGTPQGHEGTRSNQTLTLPGAEPMRGLAIESPGPTLSTNWLTNNPNKLNGTWQIVVLVRGFVHVGQLEVLPEGGYLLKNAHNIRRWGTSTGLGELTNGPTNNTSYDKLQTPVFIPDHSIVFMLQTIQWPTS